MSDNYRFDLSGGVNLGLALQIAFQHRTATHWCETPSLPRKPRGPGVAGFWYPPNLVLFWTSPGLEITPRGETRRLARPDVIPDPVPVYKLPGKGLDIAAAEPFIRAWLEGADYGHQPDHDGDNGKTYRIYNESWGHALGMWQAFAIIEPCWAMYGK